MFDHHDIEVLGISDVPLDRDIYLMDEVWMEAYAAALKTCLAGGDFENVGRISYASAHGATDSGVELSWYPNINTRFHEMRVQLPASAFVTCVHCWELSEKPRVFVRSEWLTALHMRAHSAFAMVDANGVKAALAAGGITPDRMTDLTARIDAIAAAHPDLAFVSFADSLIVKGHWSVGTWDSDVNYTYEPEQILRVLPLINQAYRDVLGLNIYAMVTQGLNPFHDQLMHLSASGNHFSLNSLGLPFAQLQAMEAQARAAIRNGDHGPAELYLDSDFFNSLNWRFGFEKQKEPRGSYAAPMAQAPCVYVMMSFQRLFENLESEEPAADETHAGEAK